MYKKFHKIIMFCISMCVRVLYTEQHVIRIEILVAIFHLNTLTVGL